MPGSRRTAWTEPFGAAPLILLPRRPWTPAAPDRRQLMAQRGHDDKRGRLIAGPGIFTGNVVLRAAQIRVDRQVAMWMILPVAIGAPDVSPDLGRPQCLLAGAQDDPQGFVVEEKRQAGHRETLSVVRCPLSEGKRAATGSDSSKDCRITDYGEQGGAGRGGSVQSDTLARVSA